MYDLAVRRHEYLDRTIDTLNTRAAGMVALTSLVLAAVNSIRARLQPYPPLLWMFVVAVAILLALIVYQCLKAYWIARVRIWPDVRIAARKYGLAEDHDAKYHILCNLADAFDANRPLVNEKSERLKKAMVYLTILIVLLLTLALLVPDPPPTAKGP